MVGLNARAKALAVYESLFGQPPDLANFDGRIKFQKVAYAAKLIGIDFGNVNFIWYRRGPYSFDIGGWSNCIKEELSAAEKKTIAANKATMLKFLSKPDDAELFSSVAYLMNEERLSEEETVGRMQLVKPWFTVEQVKKAIEDVKSFIGGM